MLEAIQKEIVLKKNYLDHPLIETIYFGGGTPSLLESTEIEKLLERISENYSLAENPEITLEANPDDINPEKLKEFKSIGINRLSIGVQSFFDDDLAWLGRTHSGASAFRAVSQSLSCGFPDLTIDLIYGIPAIGRPDHWEENLDQMKSLDVPHFSAYALTVEPRTILAHQIEKGLTKAADDEVVVKQYFELLDFAGSNDYEQYEISNFARPGHHSRHNSSYWSQKPYIGAGPSAHSFDLVSRQWNVAINSEYIRKMKDGELFFEKEILTQKDRINEYLMLSLRTSKGLDIQRMRTMLHEDEFRELSARINENILKELMSGSKENIFLTVKGMIFSDKIISELFIL